MPAGDAPDDGLDARAQAIDPGGRDDCRRSSRLPQYPRAARISKQPRKVEVQRLARLAMRRLMGIADPEMALEAGILAGTNVVARPVDSPTAKREIVLAWRKNSPREADFLLLAEELRAG